MTKRPTSARSLTLPEHACPTCADLWARFRTHVENEHPYQPSTRWHCGVCSFELDTPDPDVFLDHLGTHLTIRHVPFND
jgi:hypothetical protein